MTETIQRVYRLMASLDYVKKLSLAVAKGEPNPIASVTGHVRSYHNMDASFERNQYTITLELVRIRQAAITTARLLMETEVHHCLD